MITKNKSVSQTEHHQRFIRIALQQAKKAERIGEVPVGAVAVLNDKIVASGYNRVIKDNDPTAHAEIVAIRKAAKKIGNYRLNNIDLYVTLEPCPMCAAMLVNARIKKIIYGAHDFKSGACGSVFDLVNNKKVNHKIEVISGILRNVCAAKIKQFFLNKR